MATTLIGDGYPRDWPKTLDNIMKLKFDIVLPGHGPIQNDKSQMMTLRNYMEEITARVASGKQAGQAMEDLQKTFRVASLKTPAAPNQTIRPVGCEVAKLRC